MNLTTLIPLPYRIAAMAFFAVALVGFGYVKGIEHGEAKLNDYIKANDAAVLVQVQKAAQTTAKLTADATQLEKVKNAEIKDIDDRLSVALGELRKRPQRRPDVPQAAAACAGATGADLSRPDAEFLTRYDALARKYQSQLKQCIGQYNAAVKAVNAPSP